MAFSAAGACPQATRAQQKIPRIRAFRWEGPSVAERLELFLRRLRELGYIEGQNISVEYRFAEQETNRARRIGVLVGLSQDDDPGMKPRLIALRQKLDELGWVEDRNLRVERRYARGGAGAEQLAEELVALQPDVILAHTVSVTAALRGEDPRDRSCS